MKKFQCECGNTLYFSNSQCLTCFRPLGFISNELTLTACDVDADGIWHSCLNARQYRPCQNYHQHNVCNWLVPADSPDVLCESCKLTKTIPDLSKPDNITLWFRLEQAKRHLLYTLKKLRLDNWDEQECNNPLKFRFLEDIVEGDEYGGEQTVKSTVVTGHSEGTITLNLKEAEDASRMQIRKAMNERYRTLVGHFRHESGHYYWDALILNSPYLAHYRLLFGDERQSYTEAMKRYYENGPVSHWQDTFISAYASMHSWEDWAESWAHYLHIVDTLETATEYNVHILQNRLGNPLAMKSVPGREDHFDQILEDWGRLTTVLNALNRSMGQDDAYPFVIPPAAKEKLTFIHDLVHRRI